MSQVLLSIHICEELFGVDVSKVLEVLEKREITEVPKSPDYIVGIINFRGEVVPVVNTRLRFNLAPLKENEDFVIAVLDLVKNEEPFRVGLMADRVRDVITIEDSEIKPVPPMDSKFSTGFLKGIVRRDNLFIMLLDVDRIFEEKMQDQNTEKQMV